MADQRDYAQTVRNSGEALLTIIDDILDFSKVEAGKLDVENVGFDLRTIVHQVVDLLAGPAQSKGVDLVAVVESALPAVVSGDPGRVRQVLTNLVGNAVKFTQEGEIVLRVAVTAVEGTDAVLRFNVADTGDGIAPEQVESVFQPFVQADSSTSRKYGGTGLGLAISSQLITLMGGEYGVSSTLGMGSDFWFTIRVEAEAGQEAGGNLSDPRLAGVTVLIVDDSAVQLSVLSEDLTGWGMSVSSADSGAAALEAMRSSADGERPFAVALVDLSMPEMDGLMLKDAIASDPALATPLVLMAGLGQGRRFTDASDFGFRAILSKPVHRDDLQASLLTALGLDAEEHPPTGLLADRPPRVASLDAGRLLLAEDNPINQKVAVAMLSGAGYQVDTVPDGAAAVEAVLAQTYDAILMDCQMPELNGYEATAAIRAYEGSARRTPIIALTAGARREDRDRCLASGMDDYLSKPVSKDALLALVARSVKNGAVLAA